MKMKAKKFLITGLLGVVSLATITTVATACTNGNNQKANTVNNKSDLKTNPNINLTQQDVENLEKQRQQWSEDLDVYFNGGLSTSGKNFDRINTLSSNATEWFKNHQKLAATRDSGSLVQDDAAYSFGIAPDYVHYKWVSKDGGDVSPSYLKPYWNKNLTEGRNFSKLDPKTLDDNGIGVLLISDHHYGKWNDNFLSKKTVGGLIMQSRVSGLPSHYPAVLTPKFLFDPNLNPNLKKYASANYALPNYYSDPLDGIILTGKTLDRIYDAKKFSNVYNAHVAGKTHFETFTDFAKAMVDETRRGISQWSLKNDKWKDKTVLMVMPNFTPTAKMVDVNFKPEDLEFLSNVCINEPMYCPTIYSDPNDKYLPGLGAKFPIPVNHISQVQNYIDDYGQIGGKVLNGTGNPEASKQVGPTLGDAFKGTSDVVVFCYNEYGLLNYKPGTEEGEALVQQFEKNLTNYVNGLDINTKNNFNPTKMLKEKPVVGKNFFIIRKSSFYDAFLGFLGTIHNFNTFNKWMNGENARPIELNIPKFNKDNVQHIRAFKDDFKNK
ncbi:Vmc-like lipoprotein signal peptide domain-containing protein [Ureaplasma urealyticum]|uniref:Vmc-like lipoprotein signal peptide domain-containing protein n=1 Tax=Ureaplasma urealyticum TaxID=2130 RepID=UPI000174915F|nr:hypothetical protein [Ureaplasma urealyticum]EDU56899.1 putative lipoprotein [Ureaplasma urealyticum serovar 7 str. ATCC 27819]